MLSQDGCFIDHFGWLEKVAVRGGLALLVGLGASGILLQNMAAGIAYLVFVAVGGMVVIFESFCVYCPYPFKHADCLFYPHQIVANVASFRTGKMGIVRKVVSAMVFLGIVAIPQYWLWGQWLAFFVFWAVVLVGVATVPLRFCRRCRHRRCPMNLVRITGGSAPTESASDG